MQLALTGGCHPSRKARKKTGGRLEWRFLRLHVPLGAGDNGAARGHKQLIQRAHAKGLKIFGCTMTPLEGFLLPGTPFPVVSPAGEVQRQAVNAWIPHQRRI
jgi:hypothetical protein